MNKFDPGLLEQENGSLNAMIFKNAYLGIPETLYYAIEVELKPFSFQDDPIETMISLDFIRLNIHSIKELENRVFEFPVNPVDGYIEGSIYLFDVHNPFDVKKMEFNKWDHGSINATLYYDIDFEFENTGYEKITDCKLQVRLMRGQLAIDRQILAAETFNAADAKKFVSKFASPEDYEEPEVSEGQVIFKMKQD